MLLIQVTHLIRQTPNSDALPTAVSTTVGENIDEKPAEKPNDDDVSLELSIDEAIVDQPSQTMPPVLRELSKHSFRVYLSQLYSSVRTLPIGGGLFLLLPLFLIVLGIIGLVEFFRTSTVSKERKAHRLLTMPPSPLHALVVESPSSTWPTVPDTRIVNESPGTHLAYRMPVGSDSFFPILAFILFGLAWNVVAVAITLYAFRLPYTNWCDAVFEITLWTLFWSVGLAILGLSGYRLLLLFRFGPTVLEISDHPVLPGRRYRLFLMQSGVLRFRQLTVDVYCEEVARFRQGTDTVTSRKEVFRQSLLYRTDFETTLEASFVQEFFMQLPQEAMHSFRQHHNEIVWKIAISADVIGYPPVKRECQIVVLSGILDDIDSTHDSVF